MWIPLTLAIAYFGSIALTAVLARTPLAVPLTGRKQEPWRMLRVRTARVAPDAVAAAGPRSGARRAGGHDRSERILTVLTEQIDEAAAAGATPRISRTRPDRHADLRRAAGFRAGLGQAPGQSRDTSGARVAVRLPDPFGYAARWPASWRRAGWRSRSIPALPRPSGEGAEGGAAAGTGRR